MFYATVIKKTKKKSIFDVINCLNWWNVDKNVTAIKINFMKNDFNFKKLCSVKGLVGSV